MGSVREQNQPLTSERATARGRRHFLAPNGWQIEGKKAIVGHDGCGAFVVRVENRLDNDSPYDIKELTSLSG